MAVPIFSFLFSISVAANIKIVDILKANPHLGEDVAEVIRGRLKKGKTEISLLTIELLDSMVKNCPKFHAFVAKEKFMGTLLKIAQNGTTSRFGKLSYDSKRIELQERVLVIIQQWGLSFKNSRSFPIFYQKYDELRRQGVKFPQPHKDETAPVFTPPAHVPKQQAPSKKNDAGAYTDEECAGASEIADLLDDMVTGSESKEDLLRNPIIQDLVLNAKQAQNRAMARINADPTHAAVEELFRVNDKLLDAIKYYEGVRSGKMDRRKPEPVPVPKKEEAKPSGDDFDFFSSPSSSNAASSSNSKPTSKPVIVPMLAPPDEKKKSRKKKSRKKSTDTSSPMSSSSPAAVASSSSGQPDLLGLDSLMDAFSVSPSQPQSQPQQQQPPASLDPFDPFGSAPAPVSQPEPQRQSSAFDDDEFMALATRDISPADKNSSPAPAQQPQSDDPFDLLASR